MKADYQRTEIIDAIVLHTECTNEKEARVYLEEMHNDGMTLDDCYTYFVTNAPHTNF